MPAQPADAGPGKPAKPAKCPICGRPSEDKYRPFCSRRCADVDLSRWLSGGYAIPDKGESEDGGEGADPAGLTPEEDGAKGRE
ncbi:MAG TPA: DNA gyrase inhibitor YacG [Hyphomicrobiaceae bacterium]|jgi:endogenous inhibitor of DNA gyrase (YacG/DUF329 family)|nr:DNA gyrase inhibitor YacG [Hyphomicrobiaceae bacterium]